MAGLPCHELKLLVHRALVAVLVGDGDVAGDLEADARRDLPGVVGDGELEARAEVAVGDDADVADLEVLVDGLLGAALVLLGDVGRLRGERQPRDEARHREDDDGDGRDKRLLGALLALCGRRRRGLTG